MNKLINEFGSLPLVKRIKELESIIDNNLELNDLINRLKETQKKLVNAKEFNQIVQAKIYEEEYNQLYEAVLDFPFVEEYLDLLDEANSMLNELTFIIENQINKAINC